jgi:ferredoxin
MNKILLREGSRICVIQTQGQQSLLDTLRKEGFFVYAPCGGKGRCGKCLVEIRGEGKCSPVIIIPTRT